MLRRLSLAASLAALASPAFADELEQRHKDLLERKDLQFAFTVDQPPVPQRPPGWLQWLGDLLGFLSPLFNLIFWGALALVVAGIIFFAVREFVESRPGRSPRIKDENPTQVTEFRPTEARAKALLEEADRLAALGKFDEAAHTLLYRSIADIEERLPRSIRKAQTSREIAGLAALPQAVRTAFEPITRAVERSWFGGLKLNADDYQVCRKAYADFALAEAWSRPGSAA
jgi:hypothetical protein